MGPCWPFLLAVERAGCRKMGFPPPFTKALPLPHPATQLISMHDLKQGLGPSGVASTRKLISNKYKLKVGAPGAQGAGLGELGG